MVSTLFAAISRSFGRPFSPIEPHQLPSLNDRRVETSFVTAFVAIYEPATRRFVYSRAGHNPPLLVDGGDVRNLDGAGGLPLGIDSDATYVDCELHLKMGQTLVLYTDGITEAGPSVESQFGIEGLICALRKSGASPTSVIEHITADLRDLQRNTQRKDDQTLIAIRVL